MRLKKIMSLVLACAMALSLVTVASAADTRVYFYEDFSEYVDTDTKTAIGDFNSKLSYNANANPSPTATLKEGASRLYGMYTSNSGPAGGARIFTTNDFGSKALQQFGPSLIGTSNQSYYAVNRSYKYAIHLDTKWDFTEKTDETLVISYEYDTDLYPGLGALTSYGGNSHLWLTDASNAAGTSFSMLRERHGAGTAATGTEGEEGYVPATAPANYIVDCADGLSGANQIGLKSIPNQTAIRTALGISKDTDTTTYRYYAINGERLATSNAARGPFATKPQVYAFSHDQYGSTRSSIANVKVYSIKTNDFKVYAETTANVLPTAKSMRIYFSNIVSPATYTAAVADAIVVKADGEPLAEGTYGVSDLKNVIGNAGGEIYSYVDVTFDALEEATTYTVEFPATITNEIGTTLEGKNVASFTTKYPDVKVNSLTVVNAASLIADGSYQETKLNLANTTDATKSIAVIYAVYGNDGRLADMIYVNDEIVAEGTADIKVGAKFNSVGTLKVFTWNAMSSLKPYTGAQELAITAPAVAE